MSERHPKLREEIRSGKIDDAMSERLKRHIANFKERFLQEHPNKVVMADVAKNAEETNTLDPTADNSEQER
jgi:F-type H+-transporting ATPase subunit alpha